MLNGIGQLDGTRLLVFQLVKLCETTFIIPHMQHKQCKIGVGVHIYNIYIHVYNICCVCGQKNILESYFNDPVTFQTFAVGLLVEWID